MSREALAQIQFHVTKAAVARTIHVVLPTLIAGLVAGVTAMRRQSAESSLLQVILTVLLMSVAGKLAV